MLTARMKPINLFAEIDHARIERRDDGVMIVPGYAFVNEVVKGEGGIRLKRSAMEAATPDYMRFGAVREMHQPIAAGTAVAVRWDENGAYFEAEIVDAAAKEKIERKVYKGFSVSARPTLMRNNEVEACEWIETSLVDRPKDPDALFLHRADGFDPDAEVECEVVPADDPDAAVEPPSDSTPPPEAGEAPAAAELSEDQQRIARALIDAGVSEERADALAAAAEIAAPEVDRAISTETPDLPIRENLEPMECPEREDAACERGCTKRCQMAEERADAGDLERMAALVEVEPLASPADAIKPKSFSDVMAGRDVEGLVNQVERAYMVLWESISSILYGDSGDKLARVKTSITQYAAYLGDLLSGDVERADVESVLARLDAPDIQTSLTDAITRAEVAETHLTRARTQIERLETALASAEARAESLAKLPADRPPPVRFPGAMKREFLANLGHEGEAEVARMRADLKRAETAAKTAATEAEKNHLVDYSLELRRMLHQRGVTIP